MVLVRFCYGSGKVCSGFAMVPIGLVQVLLRFR